MVWRYLVYLHLCVSVTFTRRPNIVVILTDDQDVVMKGTQPLELAHQHIAQHGLQFTNAFTTTPICCPSRASILTGRYLHNTGVKNNTVSGGCNGDKWRDELELKTFATRLKEVGYKTMYAGKYLNQYGNSKAGGVAHVPPGWDWWVGLAGNSRYYNYTLSVNGKAKHHGDDYAKDYLTDVIRRYSIKFLNTMSQSKDDSPFLMMLAPPACHSPFTPAPQHQKKFSNTTAPRTDVFNRDTSQDPEKHWLMMSKPKKMSEETIKKVDEMFRDRWRTLLSVDVMVDKVVAALKHYNMLDDTYIILTSDNGFHMGQFALPLDKRLPYEFDIRIPMWMSGPNITKNDSVSTPVLTIDLAPTLLDIAGVAQNYDDMDGLSMVPLFSTHHESQTTDEAARNIPSIVSKTVNSTLPISSNYTGIQGRNSFLVEYSGEGSAHTNSESCAGLLHNDLDNLAQCSDMFDCKCQDARNNTYTCLRTMGQEDTMFCQFHDEANFLEMYSILQDPYQISNLATLLSAETIDYYKKQISLLINCQGASCNNV